MIKKIAQPLIQISRFLFRSSRIPPASALADEASKNQSRSKIRQLADPAFALGKALLGLGLFLLVGVFILILQILFLALSAPCTACFDLTAWLNQTLTLLAPALASLTSGIFLKKKRGEPTTL